MFLLNIHIIFAYMLRRKWNIFSKQAKAHLASAFYRSKKSFLGMKNELLEVQGVARFFIYGLPAEISNYIRILKEIKHISRNPCILSTYSKNQKFANFKSMYLSQFLELVRLPMHGAVLFYCEKPNLTVWASCDEVFVLLNTKVLFLHFIVF